MASARFWSTWREVTTQNSLGTAFDQWFRRHTSLESLAWQSHDLSSESLRNASTNDVARHTAEQETGRPAVK